MRLPSTSYVVGEKMGDVNSRYAIGSESDTVSGTDDGDDSFA